MSSKGATRAARAQRKRGKFLADTLSKAGVKPAGDDGTFLQKVPITRTTFREVPRLSVWTADGKERECVAGIDFDWLSGAPGTKRLRTRFVTKDEEMIGFRDEEVALFLDGSMTDRRRWLNPTGGVGFGLVLVPGSEKPGTEPMDKPPREERRPGKSDEQPTGQVRVHGEVLKLLRAGEIKAVRVHCSVERVEVPAFNVVGVIRGVGTKENPALADEAIVFSAHYDHIGVGRASGEDKIFNGADDDASGCAAVVELAEALAAGEKPVRTLVFLLATGEEIGLVGTEWYIAHPFVALEKTVCNLNYEMIGRPDSMVGGAGKLWLTGDERSNLGQEFRALGVPVVADPASAPELLPALGQLRLRETGRRRSDAFDLRAGSAQGLPRRRRRDREARPRSHGAGGARVDARGERARQWQAHAAVAAGRRPVEDAARQALSRVFRAQTSRRARSRRW
jgi:hypothetical protein